MSCFDIGNTYERKGRLCVAVDKDKLITCNNGKFRLLRVDRAEAVRVGDDITVEDLCILWDVSTTKLDKIMTRYFKPDQEALQRAKTIKIEVGDD